MSDDPKTTDLLDVTLPCEVEINHIRFRKGVKLRVLIDAARRWHLAAMRAQLRNSSEEEERELLRGDGEYV